MTSYYFNRFDASIISRSETTIVNSTELNMIALGVAKPINEKRKKKYSKSKKVSNVALNLFVKEMDGVISVMFIQRLKTKQWDRPGGGIKNRKKEIPTNALAREYKEEMGYEMPELKDVKHAPWKRNTRIYYAWVNSSEIITGPPGENYDGEMCDIRLMNWTDVCQCIEDKKNGNLSVDFIDYVIDSLIDMQEELQEYVDTNLK